jgi:hypothetical protein
MFSSLLGVKIAKSNNFRFLRQNSKFRFSVCKYFWRKIRLPYTGKVKNKINKDIKILTHFPRRNYNVEKLSKNSGYKLSLSKLSRIFEKSSIFVEQNVFHPKSCLSNFGILNYVESLELNLIAENRKNAKHAYACRAKTEKEFF